MSYSDNLFSSGKEFLQKRMPVSGHLEELRRLLIRSLLAIAAGFSITYYYSEQILNILQRPLLKFLPENERFLYFTGITDKFVIYLQISFVSSLVLISPYLLKLLWTFVSPGLYSNERKFVKGFVILGYAAFMVGLFFGYFLVIPYGYQFLIQFGSSEQKPMITMVEYFSLTLKLLLICGAIFELPVILFLLGILGLVRVEQLQKLRKHAYLGIMVLSAVLTPSPDAFTMLLVGIPLCLLYEMSLVGIYLFIKRKSLNIEAPEATT